MSVDSIVREPQGEAGEAEKQQVDGKDLEPRLSRPRHHFGLPPLAGSGSALRPGRVTAFQGE